MLFVALLAGHPPSVARPVAGAAHATPAATTVRRSVASIALLGEVRLPPGGDVLGTPLGGLSGITYDPVADAYYALSDDRGTRAPARFYRLSIDVADGSLTAGDVTFTGVVTLTDAAGRTFDPGDIDPEGIARSPDATFFVSSEGDAGATPPVAPFVAELRADGRQLRQLPLPARFLPGDGTGVRNNLAFEPLAVAPGGMLLYSGTENALVQDGPAAGLDHGSPSRLLTWDLVLRAAAGEYVYPVDPIPAAPDPPDGFADNGLVELAPLDDGGTLLALERSYAVGVGNTVRLFEARLDGATDVSGLDALVDPATGMPMDYSPVSKRRVADIGALGARPDNLEGMTFGPTLPDGRRVLVLVSDDNFSASQVTQIVALAVRVDAAGWTVAHLPVAVHGRLGER